MNATPAVANRICTTFGLTARYATTVTFVQWIMYSCTGLTEQGMGGRTALSPDFGRSVNSISSCRGRLCPSSTFLLDPPDFQTFRHPYCKNIFQREDSSSWLYPVHNELLLFLQRSYFNERKQPAKIGNKTNYYNTLFNLELFLGWMDSPWMR